MIESQNKTFHKTRIAPTPSGFLHLGNVYSFALTAALAKKTGTSIFLRIDDLDRQRAEKDFIDDIFETLTFLGIDWQEGPRNTPEFENKYSQLHRISLYNEALQTLRETRKVFACNCSRSQLNGSRGYPGTCKEKKLSLDAKDVCWRLDTSEPLELNIKTFGSETVNTILPEGMKDFIVRKKDGYPSYQLSSLADDVYYGVDLIVRGRDLWDSTLAQLYLAASTGLKEFSGTTFYHHPLLLNKDHTKLSKSSGDTSIRFLRSKNYPALEIYRLVGEQMGLPSLRHWSDLQLPVQTK